jgi:poly(3-hydroxybutyrate) depolymerase
MDYASFQAQADLLAPFRLLAGMAARALAPDWGAVAEGFGIRRRLLAVSEAVAGGAVTHARPDYGITTVRSGGREMAVRQEVVCATPFATLLRFAKEGAPPQPKLLVVAPMSGHFATLLRGTVRVLLPEHDVFLTDWHNARDVALSAGKFGLDAFIDHVIGFIEALGPGGHVLAVCQPAVPVLAAVAAMAEDDNPCQPRSMTLMAGPIDTRVNPTEVNRLAGQKPIEWFERAMIATVPARYAGAGRRVYPGFMQLAAFISMNPGRHVRAQLGQYRNIVDGRDAEAAAHRRFYDEYLAVMDLPAEFYLETVAKVFQRHELPLGTLEWRGRRIEPAAIRRTALLTVEGELDDICGVGQTRAALDLCGGLPAGMKRHHLQAGAGHYGVFSGRRWAGEIYPRVREVIRMAAA